MGLTVLVVQRRVLISNSGEFLTGLLRSIFNRHKALTDIHGLPTFTFLPWSATSLASVPRLPRFISNRLPICIVGVLLGIINFVVFFIEILQWIFSALSKNFHIDAGLEVGDPSRGYQETLWRCRESRLLGSERDQLCLVEVVLSARQRGDLRCELPGVDLVLLSRVLGHFSKNEPLVVDRCWLYDEGFVGGYMLDRWRLGDELVFWWVCLCGDYRLGVLHRRVSLPPWLLRWILRGSLWVVTLPGLVTFTKEVSLDRYFGSSFSFGDGLLLQRCRPLRPLVFSRRLRSDCERALWLGVLLLGHRWHRSR